MLTQSRIKQVIVYFRHTGEVIHIENDTVIKDENMCVDNTIYPVKTLIWLYMTGDFVFTPVFTRTGRLDDLSWNNLTIDEPFSVPRGMNRRNVSGCTGVGWRKREQKWVATITRNGEKKYLGAFFYLDDAIAARKIAEIS